MLVPGQDRAPSSERSPAERPFQPFIGYRLGAKTLALTTHASGRIEMGDLLLLHVQTCARLEKVIFLVVMAVRAFQVRQRVASFGSVRVPILKS